MRSTFAAVISLLLLSTVAGLSQATRTWVSGVGDDVNPGSRTAPCKTFGGAFSKTASGGIISVIDPGGFGSLTVTRPVSINPESNQASILSSVGTNGITITTGTGYVLIRGVQIGAQSLPDKLGLNGIRITGGANVLVEDCTIDSFSSAGIRFEPAASGTLTLRNCVIRNCATGVAIAPAASGKVMIEHCLIEGNGTGISNSTVASPSEVFLDNTSILHSSVAAVAIAGGTSAKLISYGNNKLEGNATNGPRFIKVRQK